MTAVCSSEKNKKKHSNNSKTFIVELLGNCVQKYVIIWNIVIIIRLGPHLAVWQVALHSMQWTHSNRRDSSSSDLEKGPCTIWGWLQNAVQSCYTGRLRSLATLKPPQCEPRLTATKTLGFFFLSPTTKPHFLALACNSCGRVAGKIYTEAPRPKILKKTDKLLRTSTVSWKISAKVNSLHYHK